jgi:hypothetical protein
MCEEFDGFATVFSVVLSVLYTRCAKVVDVR